MPKIGEIRDGEIRDWGVILQLQCFISSKLELHPRPGSPPDLTNPDPYANFPLTASLNALPSTRLPVSFA